MDVSTAETSRPSRVSRSPQDGPETEGEGSVKWYNAEKGFGFIGLDGGDQDVFVHSTVIARSGLTSLSEGQKLIVKFAAGKKGLETRSVRAKDKSPAFERISLQTRSRYAALGTPSMAPLVAPFVAVRLSENSIVKYSNFWAAPGDMRLQRIRQ